MDFFDGLRRRTAPYLFILGFAAFPFFLKTGLDLDAVQRQAVLQLYREWRWQSEARNIRPGTTLVFERQREKSELEEFFKVQLQRDFKLQDIGDHPRVRVFYARDSFLHGRVELHPGGSVASAGSEGSVGSSASASTVWTGKVRFINNGILAGVFIGLMLFFMGNSFRTISWVSSFLMLWWYVDWNLLAIPSHVVQATVSLFREIYYRFAFDDWVASEMGRLAGLGAFLWVAALTLFFKFLVRNPQPATVRNTLLFSLAVEPVFVYTSSLFAQWGPNADWWKVYLGSFLFRFVSLAFGMIWFFRRGLLSFEPQKRRKAKAQMFPLSVLLLSYVFLISGGWAWLNTVLSLETSDTLLKLKIFFVATILAFALGSRIFSLWLGTLTLAIILPPARGYWASSIWFGFLLDGLLLGWWLSPFKGVQPVINSREPLRNWIAVVGMAWISGIFLSSVGAPLVLCWTTLILGVWAFLQVIGGADVEEPEEAHRATPA